MEHFDMKSIKFLGAVVAVCLVFILCLPFVNKTLNQENQSDTPAVVQTQNVQEKETSVENEGLSTEAVKTEEETLEIADSKDEISVETEDTNAETLTEQGVFLKAETLIAEQKYESAVYEYQQLIKNTDKTSLQAKCNEEIARIYAAMKRYGTALAYAQKAYNAEPNDEREFLLARISYKTGNTGAATEHINAILKRDFQFAE